MDYYYSLIQNKLYNTGNHNENEIEILNKTIYKEEIKELQMEGNKLGILLETDRYIFINDPVIFPNKKIGTYSRILTKSALNKNIGSVVIPILPNNNIVLNVIYRHAVRDDIDSSWRIEAPRGSGEKNELPYKTALRELKEEQGYISNNIIHLGYIDPDSGFTSGNVSTYAVYINPKITSDITNTCETCDTCDICDTCDRDDGESGLITIELTRQELDDLIYCGYKDIKINKINELDNNCIIKRAYLRDSFLLSTYMQLKIYEQRITNTNTNMNMNMNMNTNMNTNEYE